MRRANLIVLALSAVLLGGAAALAADSGPVIAVPGRHGRPVVINGVDVTGAVLEGDWGLYSPHMVGPHVIPAPVFVPPWIYRAGNDRGLHVEDGYYPASGREPGYGRREIEPPANRRLPPPAPSFHRSWSSRSDPMPASFDPPALSQPLIVAPQIYPGARRDADGPPRRR
jgi:hypothetical protein